MILIFIMCPADNEPFHDGHIVVALLASRHCNDHLHANTIITFMKSKNLLDRLLIFCFHWIICHFWIHCVIVYYFFWNLSQNMPTPLGSKHSHSQKIARKKVFRTKYCWLMKETHQIKTEWVHVWCLFSACFICSSLFLVCYLDWFVVPFSVV